MAYAQQGGGGDLDAESSRVASVRGENAAANSCGDISLSQASSIARRGIQV
eukprot:CAMPEP_0177190918 /NCGR_PEP_ID=MMETSP0367-20130122/21080_1 /TAXON_ID=447022 ORGANISM="Scrippsiella hangoei-like, Strain SHHI-4" /NCGR_SAMPLE_ID=MMETSP0367 /ASSEMBLY_ACC=CAM_ASM_000362 /LENGTH=50 /DNA_ID=CAMNT_0018638599 /DNA_START=84 /DNA_END=236 /DNA_ORIENTATION=-